MKRSRGSARCTLWHLALPLMALITVAAGTQAAVQLQFDPQNYTVTEGDVVSITLVTSTSNYMFGMDDFSGSGMDDFTGSGRNDFTVTLQNMGGTATAGSDYESGPYTVTFTAGEMSATLMVSTMDNGITELSEYFKVMIISTDQPGTVEIGPYDMALVTIEDNDPDLEVFFDPTSYTVPEDMNVTLVLRVSTPDFSFPFTVTVNTTDITAVAGEDYAPGGYTVSFQPGQNEATLDVPTMDDNIAEMVEMYSAIITSTSVDRVLIGSSNMANITIQDNDVASCPQETLNRITWPSTPVGQTANEPCQCERSQSNRAFRQCGLNGQWEVPDETLCDLSGIIENLCPAANVPEQIEALTNISMVQNLDLTTGDIILLIETVNEVLTGNSNVSTIARTLVAVLDEIVEDITEVPNQVINDGMNNNDITGVMVLETLDRTAGAIPVMENAMPFVIVERNVVVEVVVRGRADLQQSGLTTTGLRGGNRVVLPAELFSFPDVPDTPRFTAVSINNRNLLRPRAQNNRLRGNIISVNLNVPGGLRNLRNDQRIQITINRDTNTNDAANGATSCVFYDTQINDWSTEGCVIITEDAATVTCACNHLTAFSILQSPAGPAVSNQVIPILVVTLSVVGGAVFLVLAVTGVAYLIWRTRRKSQTDVTLGEI